MKNRSITYGFILMLLVCMLYGCSDEIPLSEADTPDVLQGRAILQNQENHYGIKINLSSGEWNQDFITDENGYFTLPSELGTGTWFYEAKFPYFHSVSSSFEVQNGIPENDLEELVLEQVINFRITTDMPTYYLGETVFITLYASNNSVEEIVLRSNSSPMLAYAIAKDGQVLVGSLMPGLGETDDEVVIAPGAVESFTIEWNSEATLLEPGEYQVYALLAASENYPDYFTEGSEELNLTLYDKLIPAVIQLLP